MARKCSLLLFFLLFSVSCIFGITVGYVYGNQVSSVDFEDLPKVGTMFKDSENNILIVSHNLENAVVFDKISTHTSTKVGDTLINKGRMHTIFTRTSLVTALVGYSFTTSFYPLRPVVLGGFTFKNPIIKTTTSDAQTRIYVAIGLEADVLFSNLWDSSFTLVEDGGLNSWCAFGAFVYPTVGFACSYGIAYRHYIGQFRWEFGFSWLQGLVSTSNIKYYTSFVGLGVCL